jgi:YHS domain-containing protein
MFRYLILDILLPLLLFGIVRSFLRSLFGSQSSVTRQAPAQPPPPTVVVGGELRKDPVCGTYVSTGASVTRTVDGRVVHFCSKECRDAFQG